MAVPAPEVKREWTLALEPLRGTPDGRVEMHTMTYDATTSASTKWGRWALHPWKGPADGRVEMDAMIYGATMSASTKWGRWAKAIGKAIGPVTETVHGLVETSTATMSACEKRCKWLKDMCTVSSSACEK
mmetsp:Transcript_30702/g.84354  ORF Transcript_30702/g.84354 Transcript_30702/m.84354 type:complete len:130 (-) Transcript_30702:130-519(-)